MQMNCGACGCVSREAGHQELSERLVEIQYELTDRLAFYLCGRKPGEPGLSCSNNNNYATPNITATLWAKR